MIERIRSKLLAKRFSSPTSYTNTKFDNNEKEKGKKNNDVTFHAKFVCCRGISAFLLSSNYLFFIFQLFRIKTIKQQGQEQI